MSLTWEHRQVNAGRVDTEDGGQANAERANAVNGRNRDEGG